jgi:hypothetical protein
MTGLIESIGLKLTYIILYPRYDRNPIGNDRAINYYGQGPWTKRNLF